jgi:hypothetical protein
LRDADTILKINKLGKYSVGMQKGLTMYDKDYYEKEGDLRDEMLKAEKLIRKTNTDANDDNIDILLCIELRIIDALISLSSDNDNLLPYIHVPL